MKVFEIDFKFAEPFALESGEILPSLRLRCTIYGQLNAEKSNAVLVFHALTGSSRISDWWSGVLGDGLGLDTSRFAFVCVNYIGSCYGSTPASEIKSLVTTRDIARSQAFLLEYLGFKKFKAVVGSSLGGMLALQFSVDFGELAEKCVAIGATPLSAFGLALNHIQRKALEIESNVQIARQIATLSYKSAELFDARFARNPNRNGENPRESLNSRFDAAGYLDYQGEIFTRRFDADSYRLITKTMDLFDLTDEEIRQIKAKVSLVGISSDWLFPAKDVEKLAERFKANGVNTEFIEFVSPDGHDAFLSDAARMNEILKNIFATDDTEKDRDFDIKENLLISSVRSVANF